MNQFQLNLQQTNIDVAKLLSWGSPVEHQVAGGLKLVRQAQADDWFWHLWNTNKVELTGKGIAVSGKTVLWITNQDGTPSGSEKKAAPVVQAKVQPAAPIAAPKRDPFRSVPLPEWLSPLLRPYQRPAVYDLLTGFDAHPRQLDASDMGLGKTYQALGVAAKLNKRPIVLCRKAAFSSWRRCATYFGFKPDEITVTNYELVRRGNTPLGHWGTRKGKNGHSYRCFIWTLPDNAILLTDECHWQRNQGTDNHELSIAATRQNLMVLNISATVGNNPTHMRALGYSLGLFELNQYEGWLAAHGCYRGKFGMEFTCGMEPRELVQRVGSVWIKRPEGQRRLQALQKEVLTSIHRKIFHNKRGVRVTKDEIGFPKTQIIPVIIDFDKGGDKIQKMYRAIQERIDKMGKTANTLATMTAERIEIERLKMDGLVDEIRAAIEEGNHVAVFVNFNESVDLLCQKLKTTCCVRGGQSQKERDRCIDAFQADSEPVIVCNIQAGGESISLHDLHGNFPRVSLIFPTFWAEALKQVLGRIDRDGALTPTVQKIIFAANTVEELQAKALETKLGNLSLLNDCDLSGGIRLLNAA